MVVNINISYCENSKHKFNIKDKNILITHIDGSKVMIPVNTCLLIKY